MGNQEFICIAPSAHGYVCIYTTDFNIIHRKKYIIVEKKGYLEFYNSGVKFPVKLKDIGYIDAQHFYEKRDITEYVNPKYISLGLDAYFIKFYLQPNFNLRQKGKSISYNNFILDLKYSYIDGHILDTYWDIKYEQYINFKIHPNISGQQNVIEFLKKNKTKVDALVLSKCNYLLAEVNLSLNYYKLTNITVTYDGIILYQFSFKL